MSTNIAPAEAGNPSFLKPSNSFAPGAETPKARIEAHIPADIEETLRNLAAENGEDFQDVLARFLVAGLETDAPRAMPSAEEKLPILFPAWAVGMLKDMLAASGTGMTPEQYAEEFMVQEIADSVRPSRGGVPDAINSTRDCYRADMIAAAQRWIGHIPTNLLQ